MLKTSVIALCRPYKLGTPRSRPWRRGSVSVSRSWRNGGSGFATAAAVPRNLMRAAGGALSPSSYPPAPGGRASTGCDARGTPGAAGCRPRAAGQLRNHLSGMTAPQAAGKKKSLQASERDTERVQTLRLAFRGAVQDLDVSRWNFVDESGVTLAMTRRFGRATPGQRGMESVPDN